MATKIVMILAVVIALASVAVARDYPVTVVRVVDGDTVDVVVDLGLGVSKAERVRLVGVFAPERGETGSKETAERLAAALRCPVAGGLTLRTTQDSRDKYGRLLGRFLCGEVDINAAVMEGRTAEGKGAERKATDDRRPTTEDRGTEGSEK